MAEFELNLPSHYSVDGHSLCCNNKAIAIVNPGLVFALGPNNTLQVNGPLGSTWVDRAAPADILASLIATGCVLLGSEAEIHAVEGLLSSDRTSRTTAYFLSRPWATCASVISACQILSRTNVGIIGCGGIGSLCATILAGAGIGSLVLVDADRVEGSNLNRQFFWEVADIGRLKVEVLRDCLVKRNSDIQLRTHATSPSSQDELYKIFETVDAVSFAADDPVGLVRLAATVARDLSIPFAAGGYVLGEPVKFDITSDYHLDHREFVRLNNSIAPSYGPTNAQVAAVLTEALIEEIIAEYLDTHSDNRRALKSPRLSS